MYVCVCVCDVCVVCVCDVCVVCVCDVCVCCVCVCVCGVCVCVCFFCYPYVPQFFETAGEPSVDLLPTATR